MLQPLVIEVFRFDRLKTVEADTKQLYAGNSGTNTLLKATYSRTHDPAFGSLSTSY